MANISDSIFTTAARGDRVLIETQTASSSASLDFATGMGITSRHGDMTIFGNAQLDTAQKKSGSASLLLDGTGDKIETDSSADFKFAGNFSIGTYTKYNTKF